MKNNQNNIQFIIHRGSHQIGGNCVELATRNAKILIDCGLPLDFEEQPEETQEQILVDAKEWTRDCDAIFLSHYHGDHYGLLNEAPEGTKVYTSKETANLMKVSGLFGDDLTKHLDIQAIDGTVTVKDFRVTAFPVDHSAFGACAFLFEVEGKTILYSGDIRLHGKKGILYKRLPKHVDYLFLEGTNIGRGVRQRTETDMENEFVSQFLANKDSLHLVWCSSQNIDRMVALYRACIKTNRFLCVDLYAAYVLELVHASNEKIPSIKTHPNLMVYFPHRLTSLLIDKDEKLVYGLRRGATKLVKGDLSVNPSKYVVLFRPKLLGDLGRYINNTKVCLTTSIWAQYWEQDKPEMKRLKAWLDVKPKLRKRLPDIHTSGHADVESLKEIVEHIQPKTIVPIHTEHSDSFSSLFPNNNVMEVADEVQYSMIDPTIWKSTKSFEEQEISFYLTDVQPDLSGVPATIYVACKMAEFSPRILISKDFDWSNVYEGKTVSISLEKTPKVVEGDEQSISSETIEKAIRWVVLNYDLLMKHWNGEASSLDLLNNVKKINL